MKSLSFALALCSLVSLASAAPARESLAGSETGPSAAAQNPNDVTASLPCRKVVVEIDEGYGVSSHETRYECAPRD
ncbi:MAG TPA: hypothetical protein VEH76_13965 [Methylocystis sp.]|nr:hypothetical protein [Methylocystis sp.]